MIHHCSSLAFLAFTQAASAAISFTMSLDSLAPTQPFNLTWTTDALPVDISLLASPGNEAFPEKYIGLGSNISNSFFIWAPPQDLSNGTYSFQATDSKSATALSRPFYISPKHTTIVTSSAAAPSSSFSQSSNDCSPSNSTTLSPSKIAGISIAIAGTALLLIALCYFRRWRTAIQTRKASTKPLDDEDDARRAVYPLGPLSGVQKGSPASSRDLSFMGGEDYLEGRGSLTEERRRDGPGGIQLERMTPWSRFRPRVMDCVTEEDITSMAIPHPQPPPQPTYFSHLHPSSNATPSLFTRLTPHPNRTSIAESITQAMSPFDHPHVGPAYDTTAHHPSSTRHSYGYAYETPRPSSSGPIDRAPTVSPPAGISMDGELLYPGDRSMVVSPLTLPPSRAGSTSPPGGQGYFMPSEVRRVPRKPVGGRVVEDTSQWL